MKAPLTIRFDRVEDRLAVADYVLDVDDGGDYVGSLQALARVTVSSLRHALARAGASLYVTRHDVYDTSPSYSPREPVRFSTEEGELRLRLNFEVTSPDLDDEIELAVVQLIQPTLQRLRATLVELELLDGEMPYSYWELVIAPSTRGKVVKDVLGVGLQLERLLRTVHAGTLDLPAVREVLRAGLPELILGLPEGPWLDVKSQDYDLDSDRGKISIAQDVARFANGETGGIVAVGLRAKKSKAGEVIQSVTPIPWNPHGTKRHMQAVNQRLFPPPDGLSIEQVRVDGGSILMIYIPPQPEEHKPFLVQGAIMADGRTEAGFISIVRRRGEDSIPVNAAAIHATLAAGRALLRRGQLPPT